MPYPASPQLYYKYEDCWLMVSTDNVTWERSPMQQIYPDTNYPPVFDASQVHPKRPPCVETE